LVESRPEVKTESSPNSIEKKIEWWVKVIGRHVEEWFFYELLENYLKRHCYEVKILIDENPFVNTHIVDGVSFIWYGTAHYINEIVCDNNVYELDIEYTVYEFENTDSGDVRTVIDHVDNVSVRKIEERAGEQA